MTIAGVADVDPNAPGMAYAREIGVPVISTDYRELFAIEGLELLIELTGSTELRDRLEHTRPRHVRLIDHFGARLFWDLHQAEESIIRQRTEMRRRVEAERERITMLFDSIPDEIVVVDSDMVIQHVNASFLRNNGTTLKDVRGRNCYDVEQAVRGECQVAMKNCPFFQVHETRSTVSIVRKHFDRDGRLRYAALVAAPVLDAHGEISGVIEMTRDITHRIRLEEELKATEVKFRQFMEMAPIATYVKNRAGVYVEANPATCQLLRLEKGDILGRTDREILPREAARVMRLNDEVVLKDGRSVIFDARLTLDEDRIFLSTTKFPIMDPDGRVTAVCGLSSNVTHQKEVEAALQHTREYLQNILDNSPTNIITTDLGGNIVTFNRGSEISLGRRAADVKGKPIATLFKDQAQSGLLLRRVRQECTVRGIETSLLKSDGSELPVALRLSQLSDNSGRMIGMVWMARDISRRKGLMNQIIQSERLAAVGRLAAGVAHEINNPLAVIGETVGYLQDLSGGKIPGGRELLLEELDDAIETVSAQVERCRSITHRLLGFARKSKVRVDVTDVAQAFDEILPFLRKRAQLANICIHREYGESVPGVRMDEIQLEEILINLITNSLQAMSKRGYGNIWLRSEMEQGKVVLTVRDDGPGISAQVRDRLFDPFVSTKSPGQGTGLGLSICYGIVKQHDGEIRVESETGKGAAFHVVLPPA